MAQILLVTHISPPAVDGGSKAIHKIGQYLQKRGHQITTISSNCFSTDDFTKFKPQTHSRGLPVITFFHRPFKFLSKFWPIFSIISKGPIFSPFSFFKTTLSLIQNPPDFIIAGPFPTTISLYAVFLKKITHAKLILLPCFHPADLDFNHRLLKSSLKQANFIICLTQTEKMIIEKFTQSKIFVCPLGIDQNFLIDPNKIKFPTNPNILFFANFSAHKRLDLLIDAFKSLKAKYPQLKLTLLGQKTLYWPQLKKIIPNNKKIKIIFNPTQNQIKKTLDASTLLCLPSIHESFGLVFVESLARGKPVVGANTPQTTEVINQLQGGLTFTTNSSSNLQLVLKRLISSPNLCQKLGHTGYQVVKHQYTWDKIVDNLCHQLNI